MVHKTLIVERDVEMTTRDGVILRADVYRPNTTEQVPVLLQRTPYGKGFPLSRIPFAVMAAERAYAVVIQDTRGRWASDGDGSTPFIYEMQDGYDTVEWAAHQPWAAGQVGMYGESYVGYTQFAAAVTQPPSLKTICPSVTLCDPCAFPYVDGAVALGGLVSWGLGAEAGHAIIHLPDDDPQKGALFFAWINALDAMTRRPMFEHLPLKDMPLIGREGIAPVLSDWLAHAAHDEYWQSLRCAYDRLSIPIFHLGGWYDLFIASTLRDYAGIRDQGNARQKMIIGPWSHTNWDGPIGEVDFGALAYSMVVLPEELWLRWFDYWLKGIQNGVMDEPPINLYVMGDNCWRAEHEWPLARTQTYPTTCTAVAQAIRCTATVRSRLTRRPTKR